MTKQHFFRQGEAANGDVLHYKECGLDNIYLMNGFKREEHDGEEFISITDSDGLNKAIGMHIVLHRKAPSGKEIRFLRNQLDMSQAQLAEMLGVSDQSVARWEKGGCETPGPAILALRVVYVLHNVSDDRRAELLRSMLDVLQDLAESDETDDTVNFVYEGEDWSDGRLAA